MHVFSMVCGSFSSGALAMSGLNDHQVLFNAMVGTSVAQRLHVAYFAVAFSQEPHWSEEGSDIVHRLRQGQ